MHVYMRDVFIIFRYPFGFLQNAISTLNFHKDALVIHYAVWVNHWWLHSSQTPDSVPQATSVLKPNLGN